MKFALSFVALGISLTATGLAAAQPPEMTPSYAMEPPESLSKGRLAAPRNALELSIGTGYSQGFGTLKSGTGMPSVVTPGVAFDLGIGYRIDPKWSVLWAGEYSELTAERTSTARSFTTGIAAQYHFAPMQRIDPWMEAGAGYRFLVEDPTLGPNLLTHGFQLARIRAGIDFRVGETAAIGPMIGADATLFTFQDIPNVQTNISDPRVSTFVFAGLQGRFDIGETTKSSSWGAGGRRLGALSARARARRRIDSGRCVSTFEHRGAALRARRRDDD